MPVMSKASESMKIYEIKNKIKRASRHEKIFIIHQKLKNFSNGKVLI